MTKILTKLLCAVLLLLCTFNARAQEIDSLYVDSTDNEFSTVHMLDSVFRHVDFSQVPTDILIDKALLTANVGDFNGTLHDSNVCSTFLWRRLWASLHRAHVDTAISKDTTELYNLVDTLRGYLNAGLVPIPQTRARLQTRVSSEFLIVPEYSNSFATSIRSLNSALYPTTKI